MTTSFLIDAYSGATDPELAMPGCVGSSEYVSRTVAKCVTLAKIKHVHGLGKWVQLNFEDTATNAKGGATQGLADVEFVLEKLAEFDAPKGICVFFSVDFQAELSAEELAEVKAYFAESVTPKLRAAGFLSGCYGDVTVLNDLAGDYDLGWQTSSWSDGKRSVHAAELQDVYTAAYDEDELLVAFIGAWTPTGAQPNPTEDPLSDLTTAQLTQIAEAVWAHPVSNAASGATKPSTAPASAFLTHDNNVDNELEAELTAAKAELDAIKASVANAAAGGLTAAQLADELTIAPKAAS